MDGEVPWVEPDRITGISVPAIVGQGSPSVITPDRPHPEVVLGEEPTPARRGPHPLTQWLGDHLEDGEGPRAATGSKALKTSFTSTNFDDNIVNTGGYAFIPPDSSAAAGIDHVVNVANVTVRFHQKDGTQTFNSSLRNFFSSETPLNETFDPKVIYDQYENRFVIVTLEVTDTGNGDPADTSRIMLAVSDDGDPNGTWYTTSWNAVRVISTVSTWADYPGFAVDEVAVYICVSQFAFSSGGGGGMGTRQWVVAKGAGSGGFYDGGAASTTVFDLSGALGMVSTTTQPAHLFGTSPLGGGSGTLFAMYSGLSDGANEYLGVMSLADPLGTPTANGQYILLGNLEDNPIPSIPDAPQPGTATLIETNDHRTLHAVWRDDSLWVTTTINPKTGDANAGEATAYWIEIDTSGGVGSLAVADQAAIGGEEIAAGTYTYFPAIGVNSTADVGIGFSASSATTYAGAYYATRKVDDPASTLQGAQVVAAGTDYYRRTFGMPKNRWGDYSGLAVDPINQCLWSYNQYAMARGTGSPPEDGRWATAFGELCSCQQSISLSDNQWALISLPCSPNATVEQLFGDDGLGVYDTDWAVFERDAVNDTYVQLGVGDTVSQGMGYWIIAVGGDRTIDVDGGTTDRSADFDVTLVEDTDPGRWNMVGHPHTFDLAWANVKVVDTGTSNEYAISDSTSANYINNRTMFWYNGTSYQSYHPVSNPGNLTTFTGFWVRVKAASMLRFPTSGPKTAKKQPAPGWWLQLVVDSGSYTDPGNRLGRLSVATDGADEYDLEERQPRAAPYLTLVFPHPEWSLDRWSTTTDLRELRAGAGGVWDFEVWSDVARPITLSWNAGGYDLNALLARSRLIDRENGSIIEPQPDGTYSVMMVGPAHRFTWQVNSLPKVEAGATRPLPADGQVTLLPAARYSDEDTGQTYTATIDWGDGGGPQAANVDEATGSITGDHTYTSHQSYEITVCVEDNLGGIGCDTAVIEPPLFSDDFESGDLSAWTYASPGS